MPEHVPAQLPAQEPDPPEPLASEPPVEPLLQEPPVEPLLYEPHHQPTAPEPVVEQQPVFATPASDRPEPIAAESPVGRQEAPIDPATPAPQTPTPPPQAIERPIPRRSAAPATGGLIAGSRPPRRRRSLVARLAALIALLAAIAAVVLVVRALLDTGHTKSVAAPKVIKVLIPEGRTRAQIAELAAKAALKGSYEVASRRSPLLNPSHYGAPHGTSSLEGFLFPATYDLNPGQPASRLVQEQLIAFRENFGDSDIASARALHITPYELLTVASMIEREAQVSSDRAKIAAVIYNRLKQGIPLGIDATIYYAVERQEGIATYTHELTEAQLHIDSPYNTRTQTGLPPTPISNPGTASIHAAAHPAHAGYLYYVAGADGCGEQVFSTTLAAFEANAAAYKAAVANNGGHPPRCKHG
ncbi:MAG TPA: endolytic transglycosylase MltG [Solirubrobacteraceae bacterium]